MEDKNHLIAITDHNSITANKEMYLDPNININFVPAIEIGCRDSFEFLIYFKDMQTLENFHLEHVKPYKKKRKITRTKKDYKYFLKVFKKEKYKNKILVSIPHIFGYMQKNYLKRKYIGEVLKEIDTIEVYNETLNQKRNTVAKRLSEIQNKKTTFGSDAHIKKEIEMFYKIQNNKFYSFKNKILEKIFRVLSTSKILQKHTLFFIMFLLR